MLKIVKTFNSSKQYVMAAVRVSVEEHCVLCDVRNLWQTITAMSVSIGVFVCLCKSESLHVLKLLLVSVSCSLCTLLDIHKDQ